MPREANDSHPALAAWQRRAAKAPDRFGPLDDLWRAACCETNAIEAQADGVTSWAAECRQRAAALVPGLYAKAKERRPSYGIPTAVPVRRVMKGSAA
jgi:hypothetical protein